MSKTILTVDDAAMMRKMICFTLKAVGHEVIEAPNGEEALRTMQDRQIDLVIADVNMPKMDGITLTRKLRALPKYAHTPIVLLTKEDAADKMEEGRAAGATGWIVKPFKQEQLLAAVTKFLSC